ncbi:MAG TPA: bifunctional DNA-formamidopyrimidine glycosylase/DNA-(apurinic or apyrimidinic site) lyase [Methylophilaceae bacterium]|jgi:formamidopyrimidine-DNA glycosylase
MPELPEVEITRRGLLSLVNQQIKSVTIRNPSLRWPIPADLDEILRHQHILQLSRRAKYIIAHCENGILLMHLGMSGRLMLLPEFVPPAKHDHLDIAFAGGQVLRLRDPRRFGAVLWHEDIHHPLLTSLGIEPLEDAFNGDYLYEHIRNRSAAIKIVIMDGHLVVGVGNIYASEALFRAGIDPKTPANKVSRARCEKLAQEIKATLAAAIEAGGSSLRSFFGVDGSPGYFQQEYFVYGRTGQPCKVCATPIKLLKQGQRSTFYCPTCQR